MCVCVCVYARVHILWILWRRNSHIIFPTDSFNTQCLFIIFVWKLEKFSSFYHTLYITLKEIRTCCKWNRVKLKQGRTLKEALSFNNQWLIWRLVQLLIILNMSSFFCMVKINKSWTENFSAHATRVSTFTKISYVWLFLSRSDQYICRLIRN